MICFIQVKQYILSNSHHVVQTMSPVEGFTEDNQKVVDSVEQELVTGLSPAQRDQVVQTGRDLLEDQMKKANEADMACLPTLAIKASRFFLLKKYFLPPFMKV